MGDFEAVLKRGGAILLQPGYLRAYHQGTRRTPADRLDHADV